MSYMEQKMQEKMEGAEIEYDEMLEELSPPQDWSYPEWEKVNRIHNWRNYASKRLVEQWTNLNGKLKMIIAANLNDIAIREDWD